MIKSETITLTNQTGTLTEASYSDDFGNAANWARLTCRSGSLNYTLDGGAPTTNGHILEATAGKVNEVVLTKEQIKAFKFTATGAGVLYASYEINPPVIVKRR